MLSRRVHWKIWPHSTHLGSGFSINHLFGTPCRLVQNKDGHGALRKLLKKTTQISLAWDTEHNELILLFLHFHRYPNVGHEVTMEMKHDLSIFLKKTLG